MDRRVSIMVVLETFNFDYSGSNPELCTKFCGFKSCRSHKIILDYSDTNNYNKTI